MRSNRLTILFLGIILFSSLAAILEAKEKRIYDPGKLKIYGSKLTLKVGDFAPEFRLKSIDKRKISLSQYREKKNVVISFIPAAWTPVCSAQWPAYNLLEDMFAEYDAVLLGISVDNAATLHAWTQNMGGVWFSVLSDFHPQGEVAKKYGVLRPDGVAERALFIIDKQGIIRHIAVYDINNLPRLNELIEALTKL